jgi:hypothetical protein
LASDGRVVEDVMVSLEMLAAFLLALVVASFCSGI